MDDNLYCNPTNHQVFWDHPMEPISLIIAGAAAGLKPTAGKAGRETYEGFKNLLIGRFGKRSNVEPISNLPS